jgi:hypothetical protein
MKEEDFDIEEIQGGELVLWFSDKFGDNRIFNNMKDLKEYIDNKIILDEKNRIFKEQQNAIIEEQKNKEEEEFKHLNAFLDTIENLMQRGKIKKTLLKNYRYKFIEDLNKICIRLEVGTQDKIKFNRLKYNRMDNNKEQEEYKNKCNEQIPAYRVFIEENKFYSITKTEFDYLNFIRSLK